MNSKVFFRGFKTTSEPHIFYFVHSAPPSDKGKRLKLFYMTQVSTKPPTFVLFVNKKELMHFSYQRYIENRIRDTFGFVGTPIRIFIRERKEKD